MDGIDFGKYTHVNIAFGIPSQDGTFSFEDEWALPQILSQIRAHGPTKALLSVGGWTGSNHISNILKNSNNRETFLNSMVNYVKNQNLDGIDIDWEYPGRLGNTCNAYDAQNDTPNFLSFLKDLRSKFDSSFGSRGKLITLAVRVQPFDTPSGPSSDVSEFAKYVDYVNIMAYDIGGPWNAETGPNAPFNYEQGKGTPLSFVSSIDAWTNAGFPKEQLVAGLGFYGRSSVAMQDMTRDLNNQYQPQEHNVPLGDSEDAPWYDSCAGSSSASGTWQWKNLRAQGVLVNPNTASGAWTRQWDSVTQTPWLYNKDTKIYLSYDDPDSIKIKSDYAASRGLAGVMIWSANMDYNNELINAARSFGGRDNSSPPGNNTSSSEHTKPSLSSRHSSTSSKTRSSKPPRSTTTSARASTSSAVSSTDSPTSSSNAPLPTIGGSDTNNSNGLLPGKTCDENGEYRCIDPNGRNSAFLLCSGGVWVPKSCAPATVCLKLNRSIICGWPTFRLLVQGVDSLIDKF
ncbi:hypothetical protein FB645_001406 [Coemansia sp. IMI 203386]|nr:hypothetical protein FB645_001406 [Coemansia sp. IMI 203386]